MSRMIYVGFLSTDIDRLCGFYRELFEFPEIEAARTQIFRVLDCGNIQLCFHGAAAYDLLDLRPYAEHRGVGQMITFDAASRAEVDSRAKRAVTLGATLVKGPFVTYYNHTQVVLFDPDGNTFRVTIPNDQG